MQNQIQDPWFKPKTIGWGWVPANYKGWLVILAFVIFIAVNFYSYILIKEIIKEKVDTVVNKFDDLSWMIIFYSTIQLAVNSILAVIALLTITNLTSSKK
jgi:trehalose-6-phosphate synthase